LLITICFHHHPHITTFVPHRLVPLLRHFSPDSLQLKLSCSCCSARCHSQVRRCSKCSS
jgi:hypothetical protein